MTWQDIVIGFGGFAFVIALIPSIKGKNKPAWTTSLMTAFFLTLFTLTFASMKMWLSTTSEALSSLAWWVLFIQKVREVK